MTTLGILKVVGRVSADPILSKSKRLTTDAVRKDGSGGAHGRLRLGLRSQKLWDWAKEWCLDVQLVDRGIIRWLTAEALASEVPIGLRIR